MYSNNGNNLLIHNTWSNYLIINEIKTHTWVFVCTSAALGFQFSGDENESCSIDNVSVKEILPNEVKVNKIIMK